MPEQLAGARKALNAGRQLYGAEQVGAAYDRMAAQITERLGERNPLVLCVMIGGLQATAELLRRLDFPHQQDYLHASRYRGETQGAAVQWLARPSLALRGRDVLIIDDILDEGHTLVAIEQELRGQDPNSLQTAVLVEKLHDRRHPQARADFIGLQAPDEYLVGCGMDYHGYFRNLDSIWAVPG